MWLELKFILHVSLVVYMYKAVQLLDIHLDPNFDRVCITDYSPQNIEIKFTLSSYRTFSDNEHVYLCFPYDLLFSSYTTVSLIQLKMHISRKVRFQFRIRTPFTNSPITNRFVFDDYLQS